MVNQIPVNRVNRFVKTLISQCGHEGQFAFDLMAFDYDEVKTQLERAGYKVNRDRFSERFVSAEPLRG